jgi:hypothetical protein
MKTEHAADKAQDRLISDALDNCIAALGQGQKGTARQFLQSAINVSVATERERTRQEIMKVTRFDAANQQLREHNEKDCKAIQDANWLLSGHVDAGGGRKALLEWSNAVFTDRENQTKNLEKAIAAALVERLQGYIKDALDDFTRSSGNREDRQNVLG